MNEDRSEDDIDISQISKENEINNSFSSKSKERNDTKQRLNTSGSNFIVTMAQSHNVNRNITDIDMIKGNFLLKKAPFNYIQNPEIKKLRRLHKSLKKVTRSQSVFGPKTIPQEYFGLLKWNDGSILKGKITQDYAKLINTEESKEDENNEEAIEVNGPTIFINKPLSYSFKGYYKSNKPYGYGILKEPGRIIEGEWKGRNLRGIGEEVFSDETFYRGEFDKGMKKGIGIYRWPDGTIYQGEWKDNKMKGNGCIIYLDDRIYEGEIDNGEMHGFGKFTWPDLKFYIGGYENNIKSGFGVFVWNLKNMEAYVGFWAKGQPEGPGVQIKGDKIKYGHWKNGKNKKYYCEIWEFKKTLDEEQIDYFKYMEKPISYINLWKQ